MSEKSFPPPEGFDAFSIGGDVAKTFRMHLWALIDSDNEVQMIAARFPWQGPAARFGFEAIQLDPDKPPISRGWRYSREAHGFYAPAIDGSGLNEFVPALRA